VSHSDPPCHHRQLHAIAKETRRERDSWSDRERGGEDIAINHVHPGYVDTDMTSHKGSLTIDEGASSSLFAATLPPGTDIRGEYIWQDCSVVKWD